jgi:hypothetical protein
MAITWTQIGSTETVSSDVIDAITKYYVGPVSGGYLLRVDQHLKIKPQNYPVAPKTAVVFVASAVPVSISWALESSAEEEASSGGYTSTITRAALVGTPLNIDSLPIDTTKIYMLQQTQTLNDEPTGGQSLALTVFQGE